jgi:phosphoribosyl 1,2-cyclic phosphodiesterase
MAVFCPLASGSKGNCIYFATPDKKILIDAGISTKATKERLAEIGVSLQEIDAILISHEHSDHILGLRKLALDFGIPVLANTETAKGIYETFQECPRFKIFTTGEPFEFGDFEIHPFSIPHDTLDPVGFTIKWNGLKFGICTDLGVVTSLVREQLKNCDYLLIESNHEPNMVYASSRPMIYKQRVLSRTGHLSNEACGKLLCEIAHPGLKDVWLAHLSSECNTPERALERVQQSISFSQLNLHIAHQGIRSHAVHA